MNTEAVEERPLKNIKKYKAADIKHSNRLTDNDIADIPTQYVYEWIKTGQWKMKDFKKWLKVMRVIEY